MSEFYLLPTSVTFKKWAGIGLLLLGVLTLIPLLLTHWTNAWAWLITLPAIFLFCLSAILAERSGRLHTGARAIIATAVVIAAVALLFLLNLNWAVFWPVMIILPAAGLLSISLSFKHNGIAALYQEWLLYFSTFAWLLGITFLLGNLGIIPLYSIHFHWWGVNILVIFIGGIILTTRLLLAKRPVLSVLSNLAVTLCLAALGIISAFSLGWNLLSPLYLSTLGICLLAFNFLSNPFVKMIA